MTNGTNQILIWDWDGTLVDSLGYKYVQIWKKVFEGEQEKQDSVLAFMKTSVGRSVTRYGLIAHALAEVGELKSQDVAKADYKERAIIEKYVERYKEGATEASVKAGLFPGVCEILSELKERDVVMYIISGGGNDGDLYKMSESLGVASYFKGIFGFGMPESSLASFGKLDNFERIKKAEEVEDISRYVVIGDSESDKLFAERVGCKFVGIANKWNNWNVGIEADKVITSSILDIPLILQEGFRGANE